MRSKVAYSKSAAAPRRSIRGQRLPRVHNTGHYKQRTKGGAEMRASFVLLIVVITACLLISVEGKGGLQIGVKERPETCDIRTKKGDRLKMHYTVNEICASLI